VIRKLSWGEFLVRCCVSLAVKVPMSTLGFLWLQHIGTTGFVGIPNLTWQQAVSAVLVLYVAGEGGVQRWELTDKPKQEEPR
jgi:hypothetical protein